MGLTEFPNGISSFGVPVISGFGSEDIITGNSFFVDSGSAAAVDSTSHPDQGKSPSLPFATADYAIGKCTADNGDVIFLMPGHDENPLASITMDVAGVWLRGLGWGNDRPTITFGLGAATVAMSAESCRLSNVIFDLGVVVETITTGVHISAAGCILENCEWKPHATSQFTSFFRTTDAADVIVRNNRCVGLITAAGTAGTFIDGCDQLQMTGNYISGHFGEHALDNTTPASVDECLRAYIVGNILENKSDTGFAVEMDANATGVFAHNMLGTGLDFEAGFTPGNLSLWGNYMWDADDTSGAIIPTTLSTS